LIIPARSDLFLFAHDLIRKVFNFSGSCASALAALLVCGAPAEAQFTADWNGLYAGLHGGFARASSSFGAGDLAKAGFTNPLSVHDLGANGSAFGLAGGFNVQSGLLVLGLEGDLSRTAIRTDLPFAANIAPFGAVTGTLGADVDWMASLRLRAGLAAGQALLYGTAGIAMARARGELIVHGGGAPFIWTDRLLLAGLSYGAGVEYALTAGWSVKAEFIHTLLGDSLFSSATANVPVSSRTDIYNLRGGVNFRF